MLPHRAERRPQDPEGHIDTHRPIGRQGGAAQTLAWHIPDRCMCSSGQHHAFFANHRAHLAEGGKENHDSDHKVWFGGSWERQAGASDVVCGVLDEPPSWSLLGVIIKMMSTQLVCPKYTVLLPVGRWCNHGRDGHNRVKFNMPSRSWDFPLLVKASV